MLEILVLQVWSTLNNPGTPGNAAHPGMWLVWQREQKELAIVTIWVRIPYSTETILISCLQTVMTETFLAPCSTEGQKSQSKW